MKRHERNDRGYMGIAIVAVLGVFLALHLALPAVTLWPAALVSLALVMVVVGHVHGGRKRSHPVSEPYIDNQQ